MGVPTAPPKPKPETWPEPCQDCGHSRHRHKDDKGYCTRRWYSGFGEHVCMCNAFRPVEPTKPSLRYDLLETGPMRRHAERLGLGVSAKHGGEVGYKRRSSIHVELFHVREHLNSFCKGDRSEDHLAAIACRAHFAMWLEDEK